MATAWTRCLPALTLDGRDPGTSAVPASSRAQQSSNSLSHYSLIVRGGKQSKRLDSLSLSLIRYLTAIPLSSDSRTLSQKNRPQKTAR